MKILVMSDSHGEDGYVYDIMRDNTDADIVIHLGDGEDDLGLALTELPAFGNKRILQVRGNCDPIGLQEGLFENIGGFRFYLTHGHMHRVKYGKFELLADARQMDRNVVLFGHTHSQFLEEYDGTWLFNPGAVIDLHYGVITINEEKHEIGFEHF